MKVKRHKHVRKVLTFYKSYFNIDAPYRALLDGTFCKAALKFKVNIAEQLPKYLDSEVRLYTTPCVLAECQALGPLLYGPLKILEQYQVHACGHQEALPAQHCLHKIARKQSKSQHKYFIATQDPELSNKIREIAGVPILYISHNAITVESPSDKTKRKASGEETDKVAPSTFQEQTLKALKKSIFGEEEQPQKKREKKKGANPLSCKKKSKKIKSSPATTATSKRSKRKRRKNSKVSNENEIS